jgi:hypothetical protein
VQYCTDTAKETLVHSVYSTLGALAEAAGIEVHTRGPKGKLRTGEGYSERGWFRGQVFLANNQAPAMKDGRPNPWGKLMLPKQLRLAVPAPGGLAVEGEQRHAAFHVIEAFARFHGEDPGEYKDWHLAQTCVMPELVRTEGDNNSSGWFEHLSKAEDPLRAGVNFSSSRKVNGTSIRVPSSLRELLAKEVRASAQAWLAILDDEDRASPSSERGMAAIEVLENGLGFDQAMIEYAAFLSATPKKKAPRKVVASQIEAVQLVEQAVQPVQLPAVVNAQPEEAPTEEATPETEATPEEKEKETDGPLILAARRADRVLLATGRFLADVWRSVWGVIGWRD